MEIISELQRKYISFEWTRISHEKAFDRINVRSRRLELWKIILSAASTITIPTTLLSLGLPDAFMTVSKLLLAAFTILATILNVISQKANYIDIAKSHRKTAADIFLLQQRLNSIALHLKCNNIEEIVAISDIEDINLLYSEMSAYFPHTNKNDMKKAEEHLRKGNSSVDTWERDLILPDSMQTSV